MPTAKKRIGVTPDGNTFKWATRVSKQKRWTMATLCLVALEEYLAKHHSDLATAPDTTPYQEESTVYDFV